MRTEHVSDATVEQWRHHDPSIESALEVIGDLSAGSLPQAFRRGAEAHPRSVLTVAGDTFTLAQLMTESRRWAAALLAAGVARRDRVILQAPTSGALVCAYLGLLAVGAATILVSPSSTAAEVATIARQSSARFALTDGACPEGVQPIGLTLLGQNARVIAPAAALADPQADDVALIAFTSGTTGKPKGVPLTHAMLLASIRAVMRAWRWSADDRLVHALPLYHQHGLGGVHATLIAGSQARLLAKFESRSLLAAVRDDRATVLFAVPTMYQLLVDNGDQRASLRSLRLATCGSAPLPVNLFRQIEERLGVTPVERYGLTESGLDVSNTYLGARRPGVVGYPLPGVEMRLTDPEGHDVGNGTEGEIVVRGPQVFRGYLDDADATSAVFYPHGWFRTGDLGRISQDGALAVTGRLKDIIVTGGMNVSPREVEEALTSHSEVEQAAVKGVPDARWGEAVAAWVVLRGSVTAEDLIAHCRRDLAAYKCPKQITIVDSLPRNAMGKVQRNQLPEPS